MIFYQWALQHAIAGINCAPRGAETQSPHELEYDRKPHYDHYMPFGEPVIIQVLPNPADKSLPRVRQGYHVCITEGSASLHLVFFTNQGAHRCISPPGEYARAWPCPCLTTWPSWTARL
jgi:hypothetical protein